MLPGEVVVGQVELFHVSKDWGEPATEKKENIRNIVLIVLKVAFGQMVQSSK